MALSALAAGLQCWNLRWESPRRTFARRIRSFPISLVKLLVCQKVLKWVYFSVNGYYLECFPLKTARNLHTDSKHASKVCKVLFDKWPNLTKLWLIEARNVGDDENKLIRPERVAWNLCNIFHGWSKVSAPMTARSIFKSLIVQIYKLKLFQILKDW